MIFFVQDKAWHEAYPFYRMRSQGNQKKSSEKYYASWKYPDPRIP